MSESKCNDEAGAVVSYQRRVTASYWREQIAQEIEAKCRVDEHCSVGGYENPETGVYEELVWLVCEACEPYAAIARGKK